MGFNLVTLFIVAFSISVGESQTCGGMTMPEQGMAVSSGSNSQGTYLNTATNISCAGQATVWNLCFDHGGFATFGTGTGSVGVYRLSSGLNYNLIASQDIQQNRLIRNSYVCSTINVTTPFTVQAGDVIAACIPSSNQNPIGIVATLTGGSVWRMTSSCSSLSSSITLNQQGGFTLVTDTVIHVTLGVNECVVNKGGCQHVCTDAVLGRNCSCNEGYTLDSDGTSCNDINECSTNNGNCFYTCTNTDGNYMCSCNSGYELSTESRTCNDINECSTNNGNCSHTCTNTDGSYMCSCNPGYQLSTDNETCSLPSSWSSQFFMAIIGVVVCSVLFGTTLIIGIAICCHRRNKKLQTGTIAFKCERSLQGLQLQSFPMHMCNEVINPLSREDRSIDKETNAAYCSSNELITTVPNEAYEVLPREQESHKGNMVEDYAQI